MSYFREMDRKCIHQDTTTTPTPTVRFPTRDLPNHNSSIISKLNGISTTAFRIRRKIQEGSTAMPPLMRGKITTLAAVVCLPSTALTRNRVRTPRQTECNSSGTPGVGAILALMGTNKTGLLDPIQLVHTRERWNTFSNVKLGTPEVQVQIHSSED